MATANPSLYAVFATVPRNICPVAYTDSWQEDVPGVPYYQNGATSASVVYDNGTLFAGEDVNCDGTLFTLTGDLVYGLTANVECNIPGATFQWAEIIDSVEYPIWQPSPCGTPYTSFWHPADPATIVLKVYAPEGSSFSYPAQNLSATASIQVVDGYTVA